MRLNCELNLSEEYLPKDYRRGFLSLIKAALQQGDRALFEKYYSKPLIKPFTFSIYFPGLVGQESDSFRVGSKVKLILSTPDPKLMTFFYNGLRTRDLYPYPLFENTLTLEKISVTFPPRIVESSAQFKTVSPMLINNKGRNDWYLLPGEEGFSEGLTHNVRELAKNFLGLETIEFTFDALHFRERKIFHYGQFMRGLHGYFRITAPVELLNLIRDIGIGNRRSQGFGMVDLA
jgi:CRISPR-associated endoribonuclease Cas6